VRGNLGAAWRQRAKHVVVCAVAAVLSVLLLAPLARAETMTPTEQAHLEDLAQWAYRNGATTTAPDCGQTCQDLWIAEHEDMPNAGASAELQGEVTALEETGASDGGIGLLPDLATAMPEVLFGAAAFEVGWKVGGKISKWIGVDVPAKPTGNSQYLYWFRKGSAEPFPTYHTREVMPYSGYAVITEGQNGIVAQTTEGRCAPPTPPSFPGDYTVLSWWWNDCFNGYGLPLSPMIGYGLVLKPRSVFSNGILDYANQPYERSSGGLTDPGLTTVRERLESALSSGSYPLLNQWLDHRLGGPSEDPLCAPVEGATTVKLPAIAPGQMPEDYEACLNSLGLRNHVRVTVAEADAVLAQPAGGVVGVEPAEGTTVELTTNPQITIKINPDPLPDASALEDTEGCDRSLPTFPVSVPPNDSNPEPFDQITDPSLVASPTFPSTRGNTLLRWGAAEYVGLLRGRPNYSGWGYQHIQARHGWSLADDTDTRSALETTPFASRNERAIDAYVYFGPEYSQNGLTCVREVLAEYGTATGEPGPKGIITSFALQTSELPHYAITSR
jgi:hypothetical protein